MSKVSDNHELDFPARMSDGRQFTDFRQNCIMNNNVSMKQTSWLFRQDLIENTDSYLAAFNNAVETNNKCTTCRDNTLLPIQNYKKCSPTGCLYSVNNPYGLGVANVNYM